MGITHSTQKLLHRPSFENCEPRLLMASDLGGDIPIEQFAGDRQIEAFVDNQSPVIAVSDPNPTVQEGSELILQVTATDPENDSLSYSVVNLPDGASIDQGGLFRWTPTNQQAGHHVLVVSVSDGLNTVQSSIKVAVTTSFCEAGYLCTPKGIHVDGDVDYERIPEFAANPTAVAVKSGNWSDASIWMGGALPTDGDVVMIAEGVEVIYDLESDVSLDTVGIRGSLKFRTDINTRLKAANIFVYQDGSLEVGSEFDRIQSDVTAEIVIADKALDTDKDPEMFGTGFIGLGKVTMHGTEKTSGSQGTSLAMGQEPRAGDTVIHLAGAVSGWRVGDRLVFPDTRQLGEIDQIEEITIASVNGTEVTLSAALAFNHLGTRDADGNLEFMPNIMNLTRNVVIRSENPAGTRGHVLMTHRAEVDIRYTQFENTGRTTNEDIDNTTFDANGDADHIGHNESWRYMGLHMHHLIGPENQDANVNPYAFRLIGNTVNDTAEQNDKKWGITIHDSHFGLIQDNNVYNTTGAGIVTELGNETENVFDGNYVLRVTGDQQAEIDDEGQAGSGFWLRGPNNYVRNNLTANILSLDDLGGAVAGRGYVVYASNYGDALRIPLFQGADTTLGEESDSFFISSGNDLRILAFSGNRDWAGNDSLNNAPTFEFASNEILRSGQEHTIDLRAIDSDLEDQFFFEIVDFDGFDLKGSATITQNGSEAATLTLSLPNSELATDTHDVRIRVTDRLDVNNPDGFSIERTLTLKVNPQRLVQMSVPGQYISAIDGTQIPNPVYGSTFLSALNGGVGDWDDPNSWSAGRAPTAADRVIIQAGDHVVIRDTNAIADSIGVYEGGKLSFATNVDTELKVVTLLVLGDLEIGTEQNPVAANVNATIVIRDVAWNLQEDPDKWGHGLIAAQNAVVKMHGTQKSSGEEVRLATEAMTGDTTITLRTPVTGWKVGDQLFVPDSRQVPSSELNGSYVSQAEAVSIAGISADGLTITLAAALQHDHPGLQDENGDYKFSPHVQNVIRNIEIRSEDASNTTVETTRGHVVFMGRADIDVRYVSFVGLGRSFNDGSPIEDQRGAVQFRHLIGPRATPENGYQFTFIGNNISDPVQQTPFRWGVTVWDSHYGLIQNNFARNWAGAVFAFVKGSENLVEGNIGVEANGDGNRGGRSGDPTGKAGNIFWMHGALDNYFVNNVATGNFNTSGPYAYGFNFSELDPTVASIRAPLNQGDDHLNDGQYKLLYSAARPIRQFEGNEAYSVKSGLTYWFINTQDNPESPALNNTAVSTIKNFRVWHYANWGIFSYDSRNLVLDGFEAWGSPDPLSGPKIGFYGGDYPQDNLLIINADIRDVGTGIYVSSNTSLTTVKDSFIRANTGVYFPIKFTSAWRSDELFERSAVIDNVRFEAFGGSSHKALYMYSLDAKYLGQGSVVNLVVSHVVNILNFNGEAGNDFQLFSDQQHPDFILHESVMSPWETDEECLATPRDQWHLQDCGLMVTGSPEIGLTNAEVFAKYGIARAGAVAPLVANGNGSTDTSTLAREALPGWELINVAGVNGIALHQISTAPPAAPTGVTLTPSSSTQIDLSWNDVSGEDGYRIYQWTGSGSQMVGSVGAGQTSFSVTGLSPAQSYSFTVGAYNGAGSAFSPWQSTETLLAAPTQIGSVTANGVSASQIDLAWSDVQRESGYYVYQWMGGGSQMIASIGADATGYSVTGLSAGQSYWFTVVAHNSAGTSSSPWQDGTTQSLTPPAAPSGFTLTAASQTQIDLSWTDTQFEDGYYVYQWIGGASRFVGSAGADASSYSMTGLSPGQTYHFMVIAHNSAGTSATSWQSVMTQSPPPTAPADFALTAASDTQVDLSWTDSQYEAGYYIYQWTGGASRFVGSAGADATSYSMTGLSPQGTYHFMVIAHNSAGTSASPWQSVTTPASGPPAAPTGYSLGAVSGSQINLTWTDTLYEAGYYVYQWNGSGSQYIGSAAANATSYSVTGLASQQTYWFMVVAHNSSGSSSTSYKSATTLAAAKSDPSELSEEGDKLLDVVALKKLLGKATEQAMGESIETTKEKGLPLLARAVDHAMEHIKALSTMAGGDAIDVADLLRDDEQDVAAHREAVDRLHEAERLVT